MREDDSQGSGSSVNHGDVLLQNDHHIPFLVEYLEWPDLACVSSCSRDLSTSLLRDSFFQRAIVVIPENAQDREAVRSCVQQLSVLTRHVVTSEPEFLTLLTRLPLLHTLRVAKTNGDQDDRDWMNMEPVRFSYEDTLALWRLGRVVRLEMDSRVDNLALLLRDLTHLRELDLVFGYQNGNLNMLMHLRNLQSLRLAGDNLGDVSAIAALTQLMSLTISAWEVHDISALNRLTHMEDLDLSRCNIVDISPLSGLVRLRNLKLNETAVVELKPLASLSSLQQLSLARSSVSDLTPLVAIASTLKHLDVSGCSLTRVRSLQSLQQLETLRMNRTGWTISETEPDISSTLSDLRQLRDVDGRVIALVTPRGSHTRLDMRCLQGLNNLEVLELAGDAVPDSPPPVISLPRLTHLRVEWNFKQIADLPLATVDHPRLRSQQLQRVRLLQLRNLQFTPELRTLRLVDVVLEDISCLRLARKLTEFTLTCAKVSHQVDDSSPIPTHDLEPMRDLAKLRSLDLSSTSICNLQAIEHLHELRYVDLSSTSVADVTPLYGLRLLETIKLSDTEISHFDPAPYCNTLRELVLPEHVDCGSIRLHAPLLRKLLHPDRNCLWTSHGSE